MSSSPLLSTSASFSSFSPVSVGHRPNGIAATVAKNTFQSQLQRWKERDNRIRAIYKEEASFLGNLISGLMNDLTSCQNLDNQFLDTVIQENIEDIPLLRALITSDMIRQASIENLKRVLDIFLLQKEPSLLEKLFLFIVEKENPVTETTANSLPRVALLRNSVQIEKPLDGCLI